MGKNSNFMSTVARNKVKFKQERSQAYASNSSSHEHVSSFRSFKASPEELADNQDFLPSGRLTQRWWEDGYYPQINEQARPLRNLSDLMQGQASFEVRESEEDIEAWQPASLDYRFEQAVRRKQRADISSLRNTRDLVQKRTYQERLQEHCERIHGASIPRDGLAQASSYADFIEQQRANKQQQASEQGYAQKVKVLQAQAKLERQQDKVDSNLPYQAQVKAQQQVLKRKVLQARENLQQERLAQGLLPEYSAFYEHARENEQSELALAGTNVQDEIVQRADIQVLDAISLAEAGFAHERELLSDISENQLMLDSSEHGTESVKHKIVSVGLTQDELALESAQDNSLAQTHNVVGQDLEAAPDTVDNTSYPDFDNLSLLEQSEILGRPQQENEYQQEVMTQQKIGAHKKAVSNQEAVTKQDRLTRREIAKAALGKHLVSARDIIARKQAALAQQKEEANSKTVTANLASKHLKSPSQLSSEQEQTDLVSAQQQSLHEHPQSLHEHSQSLHTQSRETTDSAVGQAQRQATLKAKQTPALSAHKSRQGDASSLDLDSKLQGQGSTVGMEEPSAALEEDKQGAYLAEDRQGSSVIENKKGAFKQSQRWSSSHKVLDKVEPIEESHGFADSLPSVFGGCLDEDKPASSYKGRSYSKQGRGYRTKSGYRGSKQKHDGLAYALSMDETTTTFGDKVSKTNPSKRIDVRKKAVSKQSEETRAFNYVVQLLVRREYSQSELRKKMQGKYAAEIIDSVLQRCIEYGYQSDERHAQMLVNHMQFSGYGPQKLYMEARNKGANLDEVKRLAAEVDWSEVAYETIVRKFTAQQVSDYQTRNKALAFLARRGFDASCCYSALQRLQNSDENR